MKKAKKIKKIIQINAYETMVVELDGDFLIFLNEFISDHEDVLRKLAKY